MTLDIIESELQKPSIFKDESKLSIDYVPPKLPHREQEIRKLISIFRAVLENPMSISRKVVITGDIGTGKTAISKFFGEKILEYAKKRGLPLKYIHLNCRKHRSTFVLLNTLIRALSPKFPERGYSHDELLSILRGILAEKNVHVILTLDEIEYLIQFNRQDAQELIYSLTRLYEEEMNAPQRISLILISRSDAFLSAFDESVLSTLQPSKIHLEKYTEEQLFDILKDRRDMAFYERVVPDDILQMIAEIAAPRGDARYAIELLLKAGKYAEQEGKTKVIPEHVRKAKSETHPAVRKEVLRDLSKHEKLLLLALARKLRKSEQVYLTMGELEELYRILCEELGEKARTHTQIWEYVQNLEKFGIISKRLSGRGMRGKTTLISLPEVPAEILERELMRELGISE
ncbi:MAG: ORC1-type DNA replication protein [Candidatus Baldrarchaeia archaeon]